jgi:hypothetical protein
MLYNTDYNTERMRIDSSGNVGINEDDPQHKLDVDGGIVEQGGVLKENLLTNSGFDVWSNSTLVNIGSSAILSESGSVLNTNGTFEADDNWGNFGSPTTSERSSEQAHSGTYSWKIVAPSTYQGVTQDTDSMFSVTAGKLYRVKAWVRCTASTKAIEMGHHPTGHPTGLMNGNDGTARWALLWTTANTWQEIDVTLKATTSGTIRARFFAQSSNITFWVDDFTVYEVTPGCGYGVTLAMDTWGKSPYSEIYREQWDGVAGHFGGSYNVQSGSQYSLKIVGGIGGTWDAFFSNGNFKNKERFCGRKVTFGAWVKTDAANQVQLQFFDDGANVSPNNTGTDWEWLEITKTVNADSAQASVGFLVDSGKIAYISQPMLVFGSSIGEGNYTRPQGEIINCESQIVIMDSVTISSDTDYNLEVSTYGKLPKGVKALHLRGFLTPNAAGNYFGFIQGAGWQYLTYSPTANRNTFHTRCNVEVDQQLEVRRNATFTGVYVGANAVELI